MDNIDQILDAPQMQETRLQYAGFWIRTGAYLIDAIVLLPVSLILSFTMDDPSQQGFVTLINTLIGIAYFAVMESSNYQATLGKMAAGIKVGNSKGDQISLINAIGRYLGKIVSALLLCIGFMMVGWDEKNQGIHDKLAGTYVFFRR